MTITLEEWIKNKHPEIMEGKTIPISLDDIEQFFKETAQIQSDKKQEDDYGQEISLLHGSLEF